MATQDGPTAAAGLIDVGPEVAFSDVPDAGPHVPLDPHWLDLRGSVLPAVYMPPSMAGPTPRSPWLRAMASVLAAMFIAATAAGVCLTYGPPHVWP